MSIPVFVQNRVLSKFKSPKPHEVRVFYIGGYWRGANDMVAQMLRGLQDTGVHVVDFNTDKNHDALDTDGLPYDMGTSCPVWLVRIKLFPLILRFRPHLIICNAGGLSFRSQDAHYLQSLGIKLLTLVLSDPEVYKPTTSKIAKNFDVLITFIPKFIEIYRQHGPQVYLAPVATNPHFFHPVDPRPEYQCDVLLLGAVHADRIEPVKALVKHFDTHVYGENWEKHGVQNRGFLYGDDALSALNSAKMTIVFSKTVSGRKGVKAGILDFPAAGGLVITEDFLELRDYFEAGKEIITFNDQDDMLEKIDYYLKHPAEANAIRKAGRERVINNYTWDKVWLQLLPAAIKVAGWKFDPDWINDYLLVNDYMSSEKQNHP